MFTTIFTTLIIALVLFVAMRRSAPQTPVQGGPEAAPDSSTRTPLDALVPAADETAPAAPRPERATIRKYAHELYPHPDEYEVRPLALEVPYLYAQAIGMEVWGTSWFDMRKGDGLLASAYRTHLLLGARQLALLTDALAHGMKGDEAWKWATERMDEEGSWVYQRATENYGIDPNLIKPYPCGPEPDHHDHYGEPSPAGWRAVKRIDCKESECPDCTVEVEEPDPNQLSLPIPA
jgi:hypothetical protein